MSKLENQHVISESRPWVSRGIACPPDKVKEQNEALKAAGVTNAYHREDGRLVAHSNKARNDAMKAYGAFDQDAGYSQYAGK